MFDQNDRVSLFGRFMSVPKRRIARVLSAQGARVQRDLTRSSTHLVVGEGAVSALEAVESRLRRAGHRRIAILSEAGLLAVLGDEPPETATVPLASVTGVSPDLARTLHAFGLVTYDGDNIAFRDALTLKSAMELLQDETPLDRVVQALLQRRTSPKGRHKLVMDASGEPLLAWEDGVTTLSGQRLLPLDDGDGLDDLFEQALDAEAAGDLQQAARLFETCVQVDRKDALAAFNLGNVRGAMGAVDDAKFAYKQAIARDPKLVEARFNLARLEEASGDREAAREQLSAAVLIDPDYGEAHFNLGQLALAAEDWPAARESFERYLVLRPNEALAGKARQALQLIDMAK